MTFLGTLLDSGMPIQKTKYSSMRVFVPFATPAPMLSVVRLALRQDGWEHVDFRHMVEDESYYNLFCEYWANGETFTVVEHDIVVWPGALTELECCDHDWCTFPYYCSVGWIVDGLGCTKFSSQFIHKYPDFLKEPFPTCCSHNKYFCGLDRLISHRCDQLGILPHVHNPGVVNLNDKWT